MKLQLIGLTMIACVSITIISCSQKFSYLETAEVSFIDSPTEGLVTVQVMGKGETTGTAELNGIESAFKTLLFQGLPSFTALRLPMVPDREKVENSKPKVFDKFFSNQDYAQFITGQEDAVVATTYKNPKGYQISKKLTINHNALRRHMEKIGGVRKFGY